MTKLLLLVGLLFVSVSGFSQEDGSIQIENIKTIDAAAKDIYSDVFNNLIYVTEDNEVGKYDISLDSTYFYSVDKSFSIDHIDTNNPLNILLYSSDLKKIITLDKNLRETSTFDLLDLQDLEITLACLSSDDNLWIYDQSSGSVKKIDKSGKELFSSPILIDIFGYELSPVSMVESSNYVFINDLERGVHLFDGFAQPSTTFGEKGIESMSIIDYTIYYEKDGNILSFVVPTNDLNIVIPIAAVTTDKFETAIANSQHLFIQKEKAIEIYKITK